MRREPRARPRIVRLLGPVAGLALSAALLLAVDAVLRLAGFVPLAERRDLYIASEPPSPLFVEIAGADGAWMETAPAKRRFFNVQRFPRRKPPGTTRVFCLGGSTTYGHPYDDHTSYCGQLRALLVAADPGRSWEVINAGGISYASYREAGLVQELSAYEPDLFIVCTGHNEFLESRTYAGSLLSHPWLGPLAGAAARTRVFSLVPAALERLRPPQPRGAQRLAAEVDALLDRSVGPQSYTRDDALQQAVFEHFRASLERMVAGARTAGARMILITPASNLSACAPFRSELSAALTPEAREHFATVMAQAALAEDAGKIAEAEAALREAIAIDPRHPGARFRLGRILEARGDPGAAYAELVRARDEDVCPLRAPSRIEEITREVAARHGLPLIDLVTWLRERSRAEDGRPAPGDRYFLDHVHPTIEVHRQLALLLLEELARSGLATLRPDWGERAIAEVRRAVEAGVDAHQRGIALRNVAKVFSWAGKTEEAARMASAALADLGEDAECLFILGVQALERDQRERAVQYLRRALAQDPGYARTHTNLGIALARMGQREEAIRELGEAIRLNGASTTAYYNRAGLWLEEGDRAAALADYQRVLELDPGDADAAARLRELGSGG